MHFYIAHRHRPIWIIHMQLNFCQTCSFAMDSFPFDVCILSMLQLSSSFPFYFAFFVLFLSIFLKIISVFHHSTLFLSVSWPSPPIMFSAFFVYVLRADITFVLDLKLTHRNMNVATGVGFGYWCLIHSQPLFIYSQMVVFNWSYDLKM